MKSWFLAIVTVLSLVLGLAGPVLASDVAQVSGTITVIDTAGKKVTITPAQGTEVVLTVTDATEIDVPGKKDATLADLKVGDRAKAKYDEAKKEALEIEVKGPQDPDEAKVNGTIAAISGDKVTIHPPQGADIVLTVGAGADIEVWGKDPAGVGDLKVGDRVKAEYNPATLQALGLNVQGNDDPSKGERRGVFRTGGGQNTSS